MMNKPIEPQPVFPPVVRRMLPPGIPPPLEYEPPLPPVERPPPLGEEPPLLGRVGACAWVVGLAPLRRRWTFTSGMLSDIFTVLSGSLDCKLIILQIVKLAY